MNKGKYIKKKNTVATYSTAHINRKVGIGEITVAVTLTEYSEIDKVSSVYKTIPKEVNEEEIIELIVTKLMMINGIDELDKLYIDYPNVNNLSIPSKVKIPFQFNENKDKQIMGGQLLEFALTADDPSIMEGLVKEGF